eukprot:1831378-Lingulodinium_polyedra.AAC.1
MWGEKVWVADYCDNRLQITLRAGAKAEKEDIKKGLHDYHWVHTCAECYAKEAGCAPQEALH